MMISNAHLMIVFMASSIAALGIVALVIVTAPSFSVGVNRLRLILRTGYRTVIVSGVVTGVGMLVWGGIARSEGLMYLSMVPLVIAILVSNFARRSGIS